MAREETALHPGRKLVFGLVSHSQIVSAAGQWQLLRSCSGCPLALPRLGQGQPVRGKKVHCCYRIWVVFFLFLQNSRFYLQTSSLHWDQLSRERHAYSWQGRGTETSRRGTWTELHASRQTCNSIAESSDERPLKGVSFGTLCCQK